MSIVSPSPRQRYCTKCGDPLFHSSQHSYCYPCFNTYRRERRKQGYYHETPEQRRNWNYRTNYGISLEEYNHLLAEQNGVCFICKQEETATMRGKPMPLSVDHNHETGQVRRLLCNACNTFVYTIEEYPERIEEVIKYLNTFKEEEAT